MGVIERRSCWLEGDQRVCSTGWYDWGRWVFFGVIVALSLLVFFLYACFNTRRRRSRGIRPLPGTAWMAPPPEYPPQPYYGDPYYQQQPPPQYTADPQVHGYFGRPQNGIELQSPPNAYYQQAGDRVYQPPPGPPPPLPPVMKG